jgi:hypothetical protein
LKIPLLLFLSKQAWDQSALKLRIINDLKGRTDAGQIGWRRKMQNAKPPAKRIAILNEKHAGLRIHRHARACRDEGQ